jgi:hypothetical protein
MPEVDEPISDEHMLMEKVSLKQEEYLETLDKMFPNTKQGTLKYYKFSSPYIFYWLFLYI